MKKMFFLMSLLSFLLITCKTSSVSTLTKEQEALQTMSLSLDQPYRHISIPVQTVTVNTVTEKKVKFYDGSDLYVPANSFVDEAGNPVTGDVTISYRSIKSPSDIILSGTNMLFNANDTTHLFTTGGMFDITATSNGKLLRLKEGEQLTLNYVTLDSANYDLYYMDKTTGAWSYAHPANNLAKAPDEVIIPEKEINVLKPVAYNENTDFILKLKLEYKQFPELAPYNNVIWKYAGSDTKDNVKTLLAKKWKTYLLDKNNNNAYFIQLIGESENVQIPVAPVFSKSAYQQALNEYTNKTNSVNTEVANNQFKRTVPVISLGMYNLDIISKQGIFVVKADFKFDEPKYNEISNTIQYFVVSDNNRTITRYNPGKSNLVVFMPKTDNKMLGLLPDKKVAVFSSDNFKQMKVESGDPFTFNMKVLPDIIETQQQLDAILRAL